MQAARTRYTETEAREAVAASRSYEEALRRLGICVSGGGSDALRKRVEAWRISVEHFDRRWPKRDRTGRTTRPLGRKYGVSDNAVRKWLRWYEREGERVNGDNAA